MPMADPPLAIQFTIPLHSREDGGWEITSAIQQLWGGIRDETLLCEASDAASKVICRALLRTTRNMERRYLAGRDQTALGFAASIEQLYGVGNPTVEPALLAMQSVLHAVEEQHADASVAAVADTSVTFQCTLPSSLRFSGKTAALAAALQQAYFGCLLAAGLQVTERAPSPSRPGHVEASVVQIGNVTQLHRYAAIVQYELAPRNFEQLLSANGGGNAGTAPPQPPPMAGTEGAAGNWHLPRPIDVYEPHSNAVFYPGK